MLCWMFYSTDCLHSALWGSLSACLPDMESRCLTADGSYSAGSTRLISPLMSYMRRIVSLSFIWLYNKSVLTKLFRCWQDMFTPLRHRRNKLPRWGLWRWLNDFTKLMFWQLYCLAAFAPRPAFIAHFRCCVFSLENQWNLGSLSDRECRCWRNLEYRLPLLQSVTFDNTSIWEMLSGFVTVQNTSYAEKHSR